MDAYTRIKNALAPLNIYSFENTNLNNELLTYSVVLDEVYSEIVYLLNERFIDTAVDIGIKNRERLIGALRDDMDIEKRKELLKLQSNIDTSCFTYEKIKKALNSFSLACEIYEYPSAFSVVVDAFGTYTDEQKKWINKQVKKIMPAHLNVQVIFGGPIWDTLDQNDISFSYIDSKNMTWEDIDSLE